MIILEFAFGVYPTKSNTRKVPKKEPAKMAAAPIVLPKEIVNEEAKKRNLYLDVNAGAAK